MSLLLDTHVVIAASRGELTSAYPRFRALLAVGDHDLIASVASLWEIAIKTRLGKLAPAVAPPDIAPLLGSMAISVLSIEPRHATAVLDREPGTRDPFDRMLLAQCQVEGLRLVTVDRALVDHPLAWQPA